LVDAHDSKSCGVIHGSSILPPGTYSSMKKHKIVVILGPTASGKSELAVKLALAFNGEIISADSRQVYKGLDIGAGKITKKEMRGIPHHMLDIASPKTRFTVSRFQILAQKMIEDTASRGKLPIICGGTGFYIQSIVDGIVLPDVKPNPTLRKELSKKSLEEQAFMLKKIDPERAKNIDLKNPVRVLRALEIASALGSVPPLIKTERYDTLQIGIKAQPEELEAKISIRLKKRLKAGMVSEVKKLHATGLSWKRIDELGLEYRYVGRYLQGIMTKAELVALLETEIKQYARRQMTWFRKDARIKWLALEEEKRMESLIKRFLASKK
jgi:tRNA dimethylallyltransferase